MEVTKERFEDAGEQDENGYYDYYYSGYIYQFRSGHEGFVARQYDETAMEASFLTREVKGNRKWKSERFEAVPYENSSFRAAIKYLVEIAKIHKVSLLISSYVSVNIQKII